MGKNKDKQIRDLQKENNKLKAENQKLKETLDELKKSEKELKISKRKQEEENWYNLIKRNTYKDETRIIVRKWKNMWNFFGSLLRFFLLRKKDMSGTHVAFLQKKSTASLFRSTVSLILICGAIYIVAPDFCCRVNEWLKQFTWLTNYILLLMKIIVVFTMVFEAKIQYLVSGEIDNSHDEEFVDDNLSKLSEVISPNKQ